MKSNWLTEYHKKIGYNGCKNCKHQIEPLRTCEWNDNLRNHKVLHLTCPKWEKKI